jgi:hypothetical protein
MHSFRQELWVTCNSVIDTNIEERLEILFLTGWVLVSVGMKMVLAM